MSQTSYDLNQGKAQAGMKYDIGNDYVSTKNNAAAVPFGYGVVRDAADGKVKIPASGADLFMGVALHSHTVEQDENGLVVWEAKSAMPVLSQGRVWVPVEDIAEINESADVYLRHGDGGGGTVEGVFRHDADTATALQVTRARWTGQTAPGLAVLELNLP